MRTVCLVAAFILILVTCFSAAAYDRGYLEQQIDWVISKIDEGNNTMHFLAADYLRAAVEMRGFPQWKLDRLRDYLQNVRPHPPIIDRLR